MVAETKIKIKAAVRRDDRCLGARVSLGTDDLLVLSVKYSYFAFRAVDDDERMYELLKSGGKKKALSSYRARARP